MGFWCSTLEGVGVIVRRQITPAFWTGKRVLVTGHTGFKGSWLSLWLSELGAQVSGVGLEPDSTPNLYAQLQLERRLRHHWITDVRDPQAIAQLVETCQPQVVFHLAAQPLVRRSYRDPLGTWATNVQGSLHVLEALKLLHHPCAVIMVTTDKVYENQEWDYGYREGDRLGGNDPYSASKAAAELAIASWRSSFCGSGHHQIRHLAISTARAGNVIGGGDWSEDRIVPDVIRAAAADQHIEVRNPAATRPWQHVLEPLSGYMILAESIYQKLLILEEDGAEWNAFNFGPLLDSTRSVTQLIQEIANHWPGKWEQHFVQAGLHEAQRLHLNIDKAYFRLQWQPLWNFSLTVERTVHWYFRVIKEQCQPESCCLSDIAAYTQDMNSKHCATLP